MPLKHKKKLIAKEHPLQDALRVSIKSTPWQAFEKSYGVRRFGRVSYGNILKSATYG
jgi:hypothetical protein